MTGTRGRRAGFTLMEVVFAVAIVATALLALQATVSGSIRSAGDSINRRAARELCRAKLEEILAGQESPDGGGEVEDRPGFRWSGRSEELQLGMPDAQTETVTVVTVEVTFPVDADSGGAGGDTGALDGPEAGSDRVRLAGILPPPPPSASAGSAPAGGAPPAGGTGQ